MSIGIVYCKKENEPTKSKANQVKTQILRDKEN